MKKILAILSSFNVAIPFFSSAISCSKSSIDFFSATLSTKCLNLLFKNQANLNSIVPINFKNLKYDNGAWEHLGFQELLAILKVSNPNINENSFEYQNLNKSDKEFLNEISRKYFKIENDKIDFTGLTLNIENIFINSIEIYSPDNIELSTFWAVTVSRGWSSVAKCVLNFDITSKDNDYYQKSDILKIINIVISNNGLDFKSKWDSEKNIFLVSGMKYNDIDSYSSSWGERIANAFPKADNVWDKFNFSINKDKTGFSIAGINYKLVD